MKCAGSVFKNLLFKNLPPHAARSRARQRCARGQSARRLVSGTRRAKGITAAISTSPTTTPNLVYNGGAGTAPTSAP